MAIPKDAACSHVEPRSAFLGDARQLLLDERGIDRQRLARPLLGLEADLFEQFLHHRLKPPRTDILEGFVDLRGDPGKRVDAVVGER